MIVDDGFVFILVQTLLIGFDNLNINDERFSTQETELNCSEFLSNNEDKQHKVTSCKGGKLKTTRKHQLSVEYILQNKPKEPYALRSVQLDKGRTDKDKVKCKRKKKELQINLDCRFNVPVFEFSRSNSLIVFSDKDSTINANISREKFFYNKCMTQTQAAVLIQKTWRGTSRGSYSSSISMRRRPR